MLDDGRLRQVVERSGVRTGAQRLDQFDDVHPAPRAQDAVDARHLAGDFDAVALGQAAGGDQQLALALLSRQLFQHLERLFPGRGR